MSVVKRKRKSENNSDAGQLVLFCTKKNREKKPRQDDGKRL